MNPNCINDCLRGMIGHSMLLGRPLLYRHRVVDTNHAAQMS